MASYVWHSDVHLNTQLAPSGSRFSSLHPINFDVRPTYMCIYTYILGIPNRLFFPEILQHPKIQNPTKNLVVSTVRAPFFKRHTRAARCVAVGNSYRIAKVQGLKDVEDTCKNNNGDWKQTKIGWSGWTAINGDQRVTFLIFGEKFWYRFYRSNGILFFFVRSFFWDFVAGWLYDFSKGIIVFLVGGGGVCLLSSSSVFWLIL